MTNAISFALVVLLAGLGLTGLLTLLRAGFPPLAVRWDAAAAQRGGVRRLALGLLNGPVLFLLAAALGNHRPLKLLSLLLFLILLFLLIAGLAAEIPSIGRRVLAMGKRDASELGSLLMGGAVFTASFLIPFVGWLACGIVALMAVGTSVSALFIRRAQPTIAPEAK
jgi:hypothetical protein